MACLLVLILPNKAVSDDVSFYSAIHYFCSYVDDYFALILKVSSDVSFCSSLVSQEACM